MATELTAPGQTEENSSDIVVDEGATKLLSIYTDEDGVDVPYGVVIKLQKQNVLGFWRDVYSPDFGRVAMRHDLFDLVITSPGTYRLCRPDISAFGVNVGISED